MSLIFYGIFWNGSLQNKKKSTRFGGHPAKFSFVFTLAIYTITRKFTSFTLLCNNFTDGDFMILIRNITLTLKKNSPLKGAILNRVLSSHFQ